MNIPTKLEHIETSIFTKMSQMSQDYNALNLSQGFPDFESDPKLKEYVTKAMHEGYNQYAPMQGSILLRERIANKTFDLYNRKYNPVNEITITAGATQAIFTAIAATIHPGDEVITFAPAYDCYEPAVQLFGGVVKSIQLLPPQFKPDWDSVNAICTSKTKMIIVNSPHNPSGSLFSEWDMLQLQEIAEKHNLVVLSDEVYEHIVFDRENHESAAKFEDLANRSFITASFGKTFHNTGWKLGYCLAPQKLMKEFRKVHQFNVFSVNHPSQIALAWYLENKSNYLQLGTFYQQKRDFFLSAIEGSRFKFFPSKGTYFQLLDYSEISLEKDTEFAESLIKENGLATIPTSVFNTNKEDFKLLRICFAKNEDTLKKAAEILMQI